MTPLTSVVALGTWVWTRSRATAPGLTPAPGSRRHTAAVSLCRLVPHSALPRILAWGALVQRRLVVLGRSAAQGLQAGRAVLLALAPRRVTLIGMVAAPGVGACRLVALRRVTLHGTVVVVASSASRMKLHCRLHACVVLSGA